MTNEFFSEIAVYAINECLKFVVSLSTVDLLLPVVRLVQFINTVLMDFYVPFASQLQGWEQEAVEALKHLSQADGSFITLTLNALKGGDYRQRQEEFQFCYDRGGESPGKKQWERPVLKVSIFECMPHSK